MTWQRATEAIHHALRRQRATSFMALSLFPLFVASVTAIKASFRTLALQECHTVANRPVLVRSEPRREWSGADSTSGLVLVSELRLTKVLPSEAPNHSVSYGTRTGEVRISSPSPAMTLVGTAARVFM